MLLASSEWCDMCITAFAIPAGFIPDDLTSALAKVHVS